MLRRVLVLVTDIQECFWRNASNIEASSTQRASFLNASGLETQLCGLDCSHIATWSSSNDHKIVRWERIFHSALPCAIYTSSQYDVHLRLKISFICFIFIFDLTFLCKIKETLILRTFNLYFNSQSFKVS
jgi:hypothetical protein